MHHLLYFRDSGEMYRISRDHLCKLSITANNAKTNSSDEGSMEFRGPAKNILAAKDEILQIIDDYVSFVIPLSEYSKYIAIRRRHWLGFFIEQSIFIEGGKLSTISVI